MTDFVGLGLRFETQGAERAEKALDGIAQKADRAERATDALAGGSRRLSGATMQMLASIERAVRELVEIQRAQHEFTRGMAEGAAAAIREAMAVKSATAAIAGHATAVEQAATANIRFSHSFQMVQAGATGAVAPLDRLGDRARKAAVDFGDFYDISQRDFHSAWVAGTTKVSAAQDAVAVSSRRAAAGTGLAGHEMLNFGRQMSDVGMMLALGQSPFMVLLQQGPQVADIFQTAKMRGVSFGQAMGSVFGAIRPFVPLLVGVGTAAAVAFGGAALAARAVNKDVGDLSKGLGLTEAQMKRLKEEGVNTGVTIGDVFRGTFNYIAGAVGKTLEPVAKWFSKLFDDMTRWAVAGVKGIVGALVGGFNAIKAVWKQLPAAMGDVAISAANAVIQAIESMINKALQAYNKALPLIRGLMLATGNIGGAMGLRQAGSVSLGRLDNPNAGAAAGAIDAGRAAFDEGRKAGEGWVDGVGKGLKDAWLKAAEDRIKAAAGDAGAGRKARERAGPKGPSAEDMAEQFAQRRADIERQIEQAKMEELQAQLALTVEVRERAELERQIARQQAAVKAAQLKAQLERIKNDDKLTDAAKQELAAMLLGVSIIQGRVAQMQQDAIRDQEARDTAREQFALQRAGLENEADMLEAQQSLAQYEFQREEGAIKLLKIRQQLEKLAIQEALASEKLTKVQRDILEARLAQLDAIHSVQLEAAAVTAKQRFDNVSNALRDMADAIRSRDWYAMVKSLGEAIGQLKAAFSKGGTGKVEAVSAVADMAGQAIGGTAGAAISGAASGAMAGFTVGGPVGAAIGAVLGGIFGGISGSKAEKARKAEEERQRQAERARRAEEVARQARELEVALAEATGDVLGALNLQRKAFMEGVAEENRALAEQVYALQQAKQAQEAYNQLFLTEQERLVQTAAELGDGFKSLNLAVPQSMAEFKALADGIDRTTAAGQQLFAGLMALGPAFAQVAGFIGSLQGAAAALTPYQAAQGRVSAAQQAVAQAQANLQKAISAQTAANSAAAQAAQKVAQQFRALSDSLARYRQTLISGEPARLSPEEAYRQAKAAFDAIEGKTDEESLGKLQETSEAYRKASEDYFGVSLGYFQDLERIKKAVEIGQKFADKTATAAEQQVAALEAANAALNGINESVMSVAEAQEALRLAEEELRLAEEAYRVEELKLLEQIKAALTGGSPKAANDNVWTATSYLAKNPDVQAHWDQGIPQKHGFTNEHEWAWSHWTGIGQKEGRSFATGGSFTVGGVGGPDSQFMPLWLTPGEQVDVRRPGEDGNAELIAEVRELRREVAALRQERADATRQDQAQRAAIHGEAQAKREELVSETAATRRAARRAA